MATMTPAQRAAANARIIKTGSRKPRPDPSVITLSYMVENLAHLIPEARTVLAGRRIDALNAAANTLGTTVSGGSPTSTVEGAIVVRTQAEADLEQIDDDIATITVMVHDMTRMLRGIVGRPEPDTTHCTGGRGAEWMKLGALVWGDIDCTEKPHARGLCSKHYVAARRWVLGHGLEWLDRTPTE